MNSCHFKFRSKYYEQYIFSQSLLQVFALCKSLKKKWKKWQELCGTASFVPDYLFKPVEVKPK